MDLSITDVGLSISELGLQIQIIWVLQSQILNLPLKVTKSLLGNSVCKHPQNFSPAAGIFLTLNLQLSPSTPIFISF